MRDTFTLQPTINLQLRAGALGMEVADFGQADVGVGGCSGGWANGGGLEVDGWAKHDLGLRLACADRT
jgi:hypothetical protein